MQRLHQLMRDNPGMKDFVEVLHLAPYPDGWPTTFDLYKPPISNTTPSNTPGTLQKVYEIISAPWLKHNTDTLRALISEGRTAEAKSYKGKAFPFATFSGRFSPSRSIGNLSAPAPFICLDFDHVGDVAAWRSRLLAYKPAQPALLFVSPSGDGIKAVYRIDFTRTLADWFASLSWALMIDLGLQADKACKDISRACFLPYDADAVLNLAAEVPSTPPAPRPRAPQKTASSVSIETQTAKKCGGDAAWKSEFDARLEAATRCADELTRRGLDITAEYNGWVSLAYSLASFGEAGRALFHQVSQQYPDYSDREADRLYDAALKADRVKDAAQFFEACKRVGVYAATPQHQRPRRPAYFPKFGR